MADPTGTAAQPAPYTDLDSVYERASAYLAVIREMIRHENDLTSQRLGWMFTLHGLLFAATGFLWNSTPLPIAVISGVGVISSISIGYTLGRGITAVKDLLDMKRAYKDRLPGALEFPPTIGSRRPAIEWLLPAKLLPWMLGLAWILLIVFRTLLPVRG